MERSYLEAPPKEYLTKVVEILRSRLRLTNGDPLYEMYLYHLGIEEGKSNDTYGKLLRPILVMLGASVMGRVNELSLELAASIEMVHNFSLIHDDIEDEDRYRRGRKSLWNLHGIPRAVVAGDALFSMAFGALKESELKDNYGTIQRVFSEACLRMIEGQDMDIFFESLESVRFDDYLEMIDLKTGELIKASLILGCMSSGVKSEKVLKSFGRFGILFGRLFQIRDDVLGMWDGQALGKESGGDLKKKKLSLPVVYMLTSAKPDEVKRFSELFKKTDELSIERQQDLLKNSNAMRWCKEVAEGFWNQALLVLEEIDVKEKAKKDLVGVGEYLLKSGWG